MPRSHHGENLGKISGPTVRKSHHGEEEIAAKEGKGERGGRDNLEKLDFDAKKYRIGKFKNSHVLLCYLNNEGKVEGL